MAAIAQIEESPEKKIVVEKAVTNPFLSDYAFERYLKRGKHGFQNIDKIVLDGASEAVDAAQDSPNRQKFFLHKSVSRYKPEGKLLAKWMQRLNISPFVELPRSGCKITLIQPNTKRPNRTFFNPEKPKGKYPYNDGLGYPSIVLLYHEKLPTREHDEASHLCGHSRCVNPDHLVWETIGANSMRNECHLYGGRCGCSPSCILPFCLEDKKRVHAELRKRKKNNLPKTSSQTLAFHRQLV